MKKQWRTVMAWNTRRILIEVIQGTSDDALALATRLGGKLKHKSDDSRWQTWVGKADVEMGFDVAAIRRTAQLPDRIAVAISKHALQWYDAGWAQVGADNDAEANAASDELRESIAEVVAEREQYRAVVARQVDDKRRLFAERNEARAVLELVAGNLAAWADKREEAPESAQEHMDEAMHALVRFRPEGGYSEAASKLRLEMWLGEIYTERDKLRTALVDMCNNATGGGCDADVSTEFLLHVPAEAAKCYARLKAERDADRARADGLASERNRALVERDAALAELDELRTEWFGIAGGEQSFPSDRTGDAMARHQVDAWLADGQKARADLAAAQAKLAELLEKSKACRDWLKGINCYEGDDLDEAVDFDNAVIDGLAQAIAAAEQGGA